MKRKSIKREMNLITKADFARKIDVSRAYVSKLLRKGILKDHKGMLDEEESLKRIRANRDPARDRLSKVADEIRSESPEAVRDESVFSSFEKVRTVHEALKAKKTEFELKRESGEVIAKKKVREAFFMFANVIKQSLLNLPARIAPLIGGTTEEIGRVHDLLEKGIREAIEGLDEAVSQKLEIGRE